MRFWSLISTANIQCLNNLGFKFELYYRRQSQGHRGNTLWIVLNIDPFIRRTSVHNPLTLVNVLSLSPSPPTSACLAYSLEKRSLDLEQQNGWWRIKWGSNVLLRWVKASHISSETAVEMDNGLCLMKWEPTRTKDLPPAFLFCFWMFILFTYFWLCWVFAAFL